MTKKIILTVLLSVFMGGISAQISLRPYVGLAVSNFGFASSGYDNYSVNYSEEEYQKLFSSRIGMQLGLGVDIYLTDALSFEPGLRYMQKGANFVDKVVGSDFGMESEFQAKPTFHYVEIPLNLNYQIELGDWKWQLTGGPTIGYMADFRMQYSQKMTLMGQTLENKKDTRSDSEFKSDFRNNLVPLDLGINVGTRLEYENFSVYLQYNRSFNEVLKASPERNQALTFGVGYKIEL